MLKTNETSAQKGARDCRADDRRLKVMGGNWRRGRMEICNTVGVNRSAGCEGGGTICDDHVLFYLLDKVTTTGLKDSAGAGKKS
jgi:hypothetical protein